MLNPFLVNVEQVLKKVLVNAFMEKVARELKLAMSKFYLG